jgi:uncharacterized protein
MRPSDYNIHVPLPNSGKYIMIHGYSGAVDVVDKKVVEFLQTFQEGDDVDNTSLGAEVVEVLKQRGYLTERTVEQEQDFMRKLGHLLHNVQKKRAGFLLIPTYDCNLRCPYCFERELRRKDRAWLDKTMDQTMVDAAFDTMARIWRDLQAREDSTPKSITLYGGEPFLERNAEIIFYLVKKGGDLGYEFKAITNGVELGSFMDLLGEGNGKVNWLQITIDGPPQIHDARRFRPDGSGSFADIVRNITAALERGVVVSARTNVDRKNLKGIAELVDIYMEQGWVEKPNFHAHYGAVYVKPRAVDPGNSLTLPQLEQLMEESAGWHPQIRLMTPGRYYAMKFRQLLKDGNYPYLSPVFCSSHHGMYLLDAHGDIYVCWDSVGRPIGKVGHYWPKLAFDQEALNQWHERTIMSIPECIACKYALLCGGGCAQHAYEATGRLSSSYCRDFEEMFCAAVPQAYQAYVGQMMQAE